MFPFSYCLPGALKKLHAINGYLQNIQFPIILLLSLSLLGSIALYIINFDFYPPSLSLSLTDDWIEYLWSIRTTATGLPTLEYKRRRDYRKTAGETPWAGALSGSDSLFQVYTFFTLTDHHSRMAKGFLGRKRLSCFWGKGNIVDNIMWIMENPTNQNTLCCIYFSLILK